MSSMLLTITFTLFLSGEFFTMVDARRRTRPRRTTTEPIQTTTDGLIQPGTDQCKLNNGMNDEIRNAFLDEHNRVRSLTAKGLAENPFSSSGYAPKAARMLKMIYDCKVEETAQQHAKKCVFQHSSGSGIGENIWAIWPKDTNLSAMAKSASFSWFDELKQYGMPEDNILTSEVWNRPNTQIGHYTQVVYESSYKLGCGAVACSDSTLIVCQYSPPGNWMGKIIYNIGEPCKTDEDCQCDGCKCSHDEALCIKPN